MLSVYKNSITLPKHPFRNLESANNNFSNLVTSMANVTISSEARQHSCEYEYTYDAVFFQKIIAAQSYYTIY